MQFISDFVVLVVGATSSEGFLLIWNIESVRTFDSC